MKGLIYQWVSLKALKLYKGRGLRDHKNKEFLQEMIHINVNVFYTYKKRLLKSAKRPVQRSHEQVYVSCHILSQQKEVMRRFCSENWLTDHLRTRHPVLRHISTHSSMENGKNLETSDFEMGIEINELDFSTHFCRTRSYIINKLEKAVEQLLSVLHFSFECLSVCVFVQLTNKDKTE